MLNTGLRRGEVCGLLNSDIDLEHRVLHVRRAVKEYYRRDGMDRAKGQETKVGPPKSATSVRDVPLNNTAVEMITRLREEVYLGEDHPLIPNDDGGYLKPINLLRRFYRLQTAAGIPKEEQKGLHALRHPYVKLKSKKYCIFLSKHNEPSHLLAITRLFSFYSDQFTVIRLSLSTVILSI